MTTKTIFLNPLCWRQLTGRCGSPSSRASRPEGADAGGSAIAPSDSEPGGWRVATRQGCAQKLKLQNLKTVGITSFSTTPTT